jgi:hypothetical protein
MQENLGDVEKYLGVISLPDFSSKVLRIAVPTGSK